MTIHEIRRKYLDFCKKKGHVEISSAPLLAEDDPTLLFVNSGMFPLVPYLLGEKVHPAGSRLTNSQRCFRSDDIDELGDHRHQTMFEMLGNWSLGDYFKKEQLTWWYEFLIEELNMDANRLYQSVYAGDSNAPRDEESIEVLKEIFEKYGISNAVGRTTSEKGELGCGEAVDWEKQRIFPYIDKNWWKRGDAIGELGGPDSETFYDTGKEHDPAFGEHCHINCDCGRFVEIGNSVFMQFKKTAEGWEELSQKNVDFGGGLERITMALQNTDNVFKTDAFSYIIEYLESLTDIKYEMNSKAYEIVADHLRGSIFLIADGAFPSNKDQGYYLRRLIRRAMVYLGKLNISNDKLAGIVSLVVKNMSVAYDYLLEKEDHILNILEGEVKKFDRTINKGVKYFNTLKIENNIVSGLDIFTLFTTYGFPVELVEEMATEHKYTLDLEDYEKRFKEHQELSRKGAEQKFKGGLADNQEATVALHTATHLLHKALKEVLGDHVEQKGSNITPDRLRFDFVHGEKMNPEQKQAVEELVNKYIETGADVNCEEMTVEEALSSGSIGLFKERYDEKVTVYSVVNNDDLISREICRGPHVKNLSELGHFKIKKEESSSAGIRRIKAILE